MAFLTRIFCLFAACNQSFPKLNSVSMVRGEDVGDPLFLTPLIESGRIEEARKLATVQHKEMKDVTSYAGYFTVNKEYNSNMFFWFFPAKINPKRAPVVLWLQGGPGLTSLYGLLVENGPFSVKNTKLKTRKYSWHINHNLIYIDNPVGTGYSFTENDLGYVSSYIDVGRDVLTALVQFFLLFPELQTNDFFVTGESYGGKFVPAVSYAIKNYNSRAKIAINLQGLAIGNGFTDPYNQLHYSDYLYQIGLIDFNGRDKFKLLEDKARELIEQQKYEEAYEVHDELISNLFSNLTGFDFYYNYLQTKDPNGSDEYATWLQKPDVRRAIHVGNRSFRAKSMEVHERFRSDYMRSAIFFLLDLLQHYKVLLYSGQLDIIVAYPLTENYLLNLDWPSANEYKKAVRKQWWVGKDLAGYLKTAGNLTEVLVRNAGHIVPFDQPKWAWDLITSFTHHKSFVSDLMNKL